MMLKRKKLSVAISAVLVTMAVLPTVDNAIAATLTLPNDAANYTHTSALFATGSPGIEAGTTAAYSGTLTNSGTVTVTASNTGYGILISDDLSGGIVDSGSLSVTIDGGTGAINAYGIKVEGAVESSGNITVTNTGAISVSGGDSSYSAAVYAYGIYVSGNIDGTLTNDGTITVNATASSTTAVAVGIYAYGPSLSGDITNSGTITTTATGYDAGTNNSAVAGIYLGGDYSGTVTNTSTSTISVTAYATGSDAYAHGVAIDGDLSGHVINQGTIKVEVSAASSDVYDGGAIHISGGVTSSGSITNSGTIKYDILAADDSAEAAGIAVSGVMAGTLKNSGNIVMTANVAGTSEKCFPWDTSQP